MLPVPGGHLEADLLFIDFRLNILRLTLCAGGGCRHNFVHEIQRSLWRFRHLIFQLPRRIAWEAQHLSLLSTNFCKLSNQLAGVVGIAFFSAIDGCFIQRLAGIPVIERLQ